MRRLLCVFGIVLLIVSCDKNNNNDDQLSNELYGRYHGTFNRTDMPTVDVDLFFKNDNSFEGSGSSLRYPAICGGSVQQNGDNLVVNDTCTWTANFDWTLIFDGNYSLNFIDDNSVRIWRSNGNVTDEYLLNRVTR